MPVLARVPDLPLRPPARACFPRVSLTVADTDGMYAGDAAHYLSCGASALTVVHAAVNLAGIRPASLLDFGAGAGRVTRWLRAHWPNIAIAATDLRPADLAFCAAEFGCRTWTSSTDIAALDAPGRYDVIWAGSVLTHLDASRSLALLQTLLSWTRPGGLVVASLHGRHAAAAGPATGRYGLDEARWSAVMRGFGSVAGYGYADYPGMQGYGVSICRPDWAMTVLERLAPVRLVMLAERAWDAHHDVLALQRPAAGG
jgi:SAM-dependent methyltransferase